MALYGALTDSFREFSNLLINQQQWKGQQELAAEKSKRDDLMLQSNLQNQQFQRDMAEKGYDLRVDQFEAQRGDIAFNQKLATARAKRENEAHAESLKTSKLNQTQIRNAISQYEKEHVTQTPLSLHNLQAMFPEEMAKPELQNDLSMILSATGEQLDTSGPIVRHQNGEDYVLTNAEKKRLWPMMASAINKYEDVPAKIRTRVYDMTNQVKEIDEAIKGINPDSNMGQQERARLTREKNKVVGQIASASQKLQPAEQLKYWQDKYEDQKQMEKISMSYGHDQMVASYADGAKQASQKINTLMKGMMKGIETTKAADVVPVKLYNLSDQEQEWNGKLIKPGKFVDMFSKNKLKGPDGWYAFPKSGPPAWMGDEKALTEKRAAQKEADAAAEKGKLTEMNHTTMYQNSQKKADDSFTIQDQLIPNPEFKAPAINALKMIHQQLVNEKAEEGKRPTTQPGYDALMEEALSKLKDVHNSYIHKQNALRLSLDRKVRASKEDPTDPMLQKFAAVAEQALNDFYAEHEYLGYVPAKPFNEQMYRSKKQK
jgi:hypothetical protein